MKFLHDQFRHLSSLFPDCLDINRESVYFWDPKWDTNDCPQLKENVNTEEIQGSRQNGYMHLRNRIKVMQQYATQAHALRE